MRIPVSRDGAMGTIVFDWKSTVHAAGEDSLKLTLGYNTAVFAALYRLRGRVNLFNMDGIEWKREKWGLPAKLWLWLNECLGCILGNHLIADHPEIKRHLECWTSDKRITVIPYGSDAIERADAAVLERFGLAPYGYSLVIARPEPENSILEIVRAFSARARGLKLVVLGRYEPELSGFHRAVLEAAGPEVVFLGAIYDARVVSALRYFCRLYVRGHRVGGTNPSLVEALGAGTAVLAPNNRFNRWLAGDDAAYFDGEAECRDQLDRLLSDRKRLLRMAAGSRRRHAGAFTWDLVLASYEDLLRTWGDGASRRRGPRSSARPVSSASR